MRWLGRGPLNSKVIRSKPGWWAVRTAISVGMTGAWALVWTAAVDESAANAGAAATTRAVVATATAARTASRSRRSGGGDAPRDLDPGVQLGGRPALVDRAGGDLDAVGQAQRGVGRDQGGGRVE